MGGISLPLVIWDIHNERVIESMGMAWDTGAPIWPYQTSDILLHFLNGPAYFIAQPLANVLRLGGPSHFLVVLPAILIWWWFVGTRLDDGWPLAESRWRWPVFALLSFCCAALVGGNCRFLRYFPLVVQIRRLLQDGAGMVVGSEIP